VPFSLIESDRPPAHIKACENQWLEIDLHDHSSKAPTGVTESMDPSDLERNPFIPSLRDLALRLCVANANNFMSLGDLPFVLVKPILQACSATQLALLEDQSPQFKQDTQEFWQRHVSERFRFQVEKADDEDWREVYERLKEDESERLRHATARLRAKNGKIQQEKLAKQIIVIDPKKAPVVRGKGGSHRSHPFGGNPTRKRKLTRSVTAGSPIKKKNSLMEKARRDTSMAKLNYTAAPKFAVSRAIGFSRPGGFDMSKGPQKIRREPAPANDNNIFGRRN
jgi:RNA polymerase II transcription factor SIII (Elongin) subunit A